eukprot:1999409-Rhodomonas_salina.1
MSKLIGVRGGGRASEHGRHPADRRNIPLPNASVARPARISSMTSFSSLGSFGSSSSFSSSSSSLILCLPSPSSPSRAVVCCCLFSAIARTGRSTQEKEKKKKGTISRFRACSLPRAPSHASPRRPARGTSQGQYWTSHREVAALRRAVSDTA